MSELYDLEKPDKPVCDLMGNELIRGQVIAYSKSGQGSRSLYVGVITTILKMNGGRFSHSIYTVSSNGWFGGEHRANIGVNDSIVILNDPLFSLNSTRIARLFDMIDQVRGKSHGDIFKIPSPYNSVLWEREVTWKSILPADYQYGEPIDDTQMVSVPNKKAVSGANRQLKKKRAEQQNGKKV
jgi:hypothetical protein